jgi:hypothetical protein
MISAVKHSRPKNQSENASNNENQPYHSTVQHTYTTMQLSHHFSQTVPRLLSLLALCSTLCQCASSQKQYAPVVSPQTGEKMVFGIKGKSGALAKSSQTMAVMEEMQSELEQDCKTKRGPWQILTLADPKEQFLAFTFIAPEAVVEKPNGQKITALFPLIAVHTVGLDRERVTAAMPSMQRYGYHLLAKHTEPIKLTDLKKKHIDSCKSNGMKQIMLAC